MSKVLKRLYLGDVVASFGTKQLRKLTTEKPTEEPAESVTGWRKLKADYTPIDVVKQPMSEAAIAELFEAYGMTIVTDTDTDGVACILNITNDDWGLHFITRNTSSDGEVYYDALNESSVYFGIEMFQNDGFNIIATNNSTVDEWLRNNTYPSEPKTYYRIDAHRYTVTEGTTWTTFITDINTNFRTTSVPIKVNGESIKPVYVYSNNNMYNAVVDAAGNIVDVFDVITAQNYTITAIYADAPITFQIGTESYTITEGTTWTTFIANEGYGRYYRKSIKVNGETVDVVYVYSNNSMYNAVVDAAGNIVDVSDVITAQNYTIAAIYADTPIAFTIDGGTATANSGMTWAQWLESDNNNYPDTDYYFVVRSVWFEDKKYDNAVGLNTYVTGMTDYMVLFNANGELVKTTDTIVSGHAYVTANATVGG